MYGGNVAYGSNGQVYVMMGGNYVPLTGVFRGQGGFLTTLVEELRLTGNTEEADQLLNDHLAKAKTAKELAGGISLLMSEERFDELPDLLQRWQETALTQIAEAPVRPPSGRSSRSRSNATNASVLPTALNSIQRWMSKLGDDEEGARMLRVLDDVLDVAVAEAKHRRLVEAAKTRRRSSTTNRRASGSINILLGGKNRRSSIDFPPLNMHIDFSAITLLRQAFESLQSMEIQGDLVTMLRKRLEDIENSNPNDAKASREAGLHERLYLASALWWNDEQDEAVEQMEIVTSLLPDDLDAMFDMVQMHESRGDLEDAFEILESIQPRDQQVLQRRELAALRLSERLGDIDRARSAAERLFGLRLQSQTQLTLVESMRRLGLSEMADAVLSRVERTSSNQSSSLASLMMLYQGQGKTDQANQLARKLLRRTKSPMSINARSSRNPLRYRTSESSYRTQALQQLQRSGILKSMIEQLKEQYARAPESASSIERLIEFYGVTGQNDEAGALLEESIKRIPGSPILRLQFAKHLEKAGKNTEACDQYLTLLKIQPDWVTSDLYQVQRVFQRSERQADLVKGISSINLKSISQPYYISNIARSLLDDDENTDAAIALLERAFDAFPQYRQSMLQNVRSNDIWKNERFYRFAKKIVLPSELDMNANSWSGFDQIRSYSGDGKVNVFFNEMLTGLKSTDHIDDLEDSILQLVGSHSDWKSGEAMLAFIEMQTNREEEGKQRLRDLVSDEETLESIPSTACWIIGQELNRFEDSRAVAMKLFEAAIDKPSQNSMAQVQHSPVAILADSYNQAGRREEAKDLLIKHLSRASYDNYDVSYASYEMVNNTRWVADKLLSMEFPVESIRLYRRLVENPDRIEQSTRFGGNNVEYYENLAKQGMEKALGMMDESNAEDAIAQLLSIPEKLQAGAATIDLMLSTPKAEDLDEESIKSGLIELLTTLSSNPKTAEVIGRRLDELAAELPADQSVAMTRAAWSLKAKQGNAEEIVRQLAVLVSDQPLEEIAEGRRPNSRQRREAAISVPLWLIARDCIEQESLREVGEKLALHSLQAARRQTGIAQQSAILFEWGKSLLAIGDKANAEARWTELLDLATRRPGQSKKTEDNKTSWWIREIGPKFVHAVHPRLFGMVSTPLVARIAASQVQTPRTGSGRPAPRMIQSTRPGVPIRSRRPLGRPDNSAKQTTDPTSKQTKRKLIPPLTLTQFRTAIVVAKSAAKNGMSDLSHRAVAESLKGGFPVADATTTTTSSAYSSSFMTSYSSSNSRPAENPIETEVVGDLKEIVAIWTQNNDSPLATYEVIHSLVLPQNRPNDVRIYVSAKDLMAAKIDSLAEPLISSAKAANQLDALLSDVTARASDASFFPVTAIQTIIAVEQDDDENATRLLSELSDRVSKGAPAAQRNTALLAAFRAFEKESLKPNAFPILRVSLRNLVQESGNRSSSQSLISGRFPDLVNQHLASIGDSKSVVEHFESVLQGRQSYYSRYSGSYGLYKQLQDMVTIANQSADLQMPKVALDMIGRACDFELKDYSRPSVEKAISKAFTYLNDLPADQRYEILHDWTMPTEGRQSIRFVTEFSPPTSIPVAFRQKSDPSTQSSEHQIISNFTRLIDAAKDAGKLGELRSAARQCVDQNLKNANILEVLTMIAQDDRSGLRKRIDSLLTSMKERYKPAERRGYAPAHGEYLIFRACLQNEALAEIFEHRLPSFRRQLRTMSQSQLLRFVNIDYARRATSRAKPSELNRQKVFRHWIVSASVVPSTTRPSWWTSHNGQVARLSGYYSDHLFFRYPLSGNFSVSVDSFGAPWSDMSIGYGGISARHRQNNVQISTASQHENLNRPGKTRTRPAYDRVQLESSDGQLSYRLNGQRVYEETLRTTSPWLTLSSDGTMVPVFQNVRIEGNPVIPREVHLLGDDQMDGWVSRAFYESQPRNRLMAEKPKSENDSISRYQRQEPAEFDWQTIDGVLHGRVKTSVGEFQPSWIHYHRPLLNDETFAYEFFHVAGSEVAHPTIGRFALQLTPDGVKTRLLRTGTSARATIYTDGQDTIVEKDYLRGPDKLPLKEDDWNQVELSLRNRVAVLTLNGTIIFEKPLDESGTAHFGIFRNKSQATRVRNAILTGDWPTSLTPDLLQNLMAPLEQPSEDLNFEVATLLDDASIAPLAGQLVESVRQRLSESGKKAEIGTLDSSDEALEAYETFRAWVLPAHRPEVVRLHYSLAPRPSTTPDRQPPTDRSAWRHVLCPAAELVRMAGALGKLDDLHDQVSSRQPQSPVQTRNLNAFLAMIAIELNDADATQAHLREAWRLFKAGIPKSLEAKDRAAEFLLAWTAAQKDSLRPFAADLARAVRDIERDAKRKSGDDNFQRQINGLVGDIELASRWANASRATVEQLDGVPLGQWATVPYLKPNTKWMGYRPSTWVGARGTMQHFPAETWQQLFFQSPLQGDFEVSFDHSTYGHREVSVAWGMHAAQPNHDLKTVQVTKMMHGSKGVGGPVDLPAWDPVAKTRFKVEGNKVTTWTNGVQIHEQTFDSPPSPWLVIQASRPTNFAWINDLRITGQPEIPDQIDLINTADLAAWRADVFAEYHSTDSQADAPWKRVDEQLIGQLQNENVPSPVESLLLYQRPMLEDGVIEFESWYEPGKFEVHPAMGRNAYLIRPDGLRRHRLTDTNYEQSSLSPGNEEPIPDSPDEILLHEKAWNQIRLTLRDDLLQLSVNDVDIATVPVKEAASERQFGLFRFSNLSQSKVRNLVYRGEWPKQLPGIESQDLASPPEGPHALADAREVLNTALNVPLEELKSKGLVRLGPADRMDVQDDGLHISMRDANGYPTLPGLARRQRIEGDFEITVEYSDLKMTPVQKGWGLSMGLGIYLADDHKSKVTNMLTLNKDGTPQHKTQLGR
ncbi:MAG: DUF1583 domain-containing protein, partial [Planctomycetota bacterium]